jgi:hypothetical protein
MRLVLLCLLLVNLALFAWQSGVLGVLPEDGREPARLANQIAPERMRVLTPEEVKQQRDRVPEPGPGAGEFSLSALDLTRGEACVELGDFAGSDLARARARLNALELGARLAARTVEMPGWTLVYLPPFKTRAEAERAAGELRKQGVRDLAVLDTAAMRNAIALGSFRDAELAKTHLADLQKRGVKGARISDKPGTLPGTRFIIRGLDAATVARLQDIQKDLAPARFGACADR